MDLHWGWLIVIYLFLGGLGAGAYLTSFSANKGWLGNSPALQRVGYFISAPIVALGTALLVFDLGQGLRKPWLLIGLLRNINSVMTWGVYILASFIVVGLVVAYFTLKKKQAPNILVHIGALLALGTCAYTGLLLAVVKNIPFWNNYLMPVLFVFSALSTGLSITVLVSHLIDKKLHTDELAVTKLHFGLIGGEVVVLAIFLATVLSSSKGQVVVASANELISGSLAIPFWGLLIGLGLMIPIVVFILSLRKLALTTKVSVSNGMDSVSVLKKETGLTKLLLLADVLVIVGGFPLRYVIIYAAMPIWNGLLS